VTQQATLSRNRSKKTSRVTTLFGDNNSLLDAYERIPGTVMFHFAHVT